MIDPDPIYFINDTNNIWLWMKYHPFWSLFIVIILVVITLGIIIFLLILIFIGALLIPPIFKSRFQYWAEKDPRYLHELSMVLSPFYGQLYQTITLEVSELDTIIHKIPIKVNIMIPLNFMNEVIMLPNMNIIMLEGDKYINKIASWINKYYELMLILRIQGLDFNHANLAASAMITRKIHQFIEKNENLIIARDKYNTRQQYFNKYKYKLVSNLEDYRRQLKEINAKMDANRDMPIDRRIRLDNLAKIIESNIKSEENMEKLDINDKKEIEDIIDKQIKAKEIEQEKEKSERQERLHQEVMNELYTESRDEWKEWKKNKDQTKAPPPYFIAPKGWEVPLKSK